MESVICMRGIIQSVVEMVMILLVCILTNEDAYLYNVWLKYDQPNERYGLDTISIHKINKECNSVKNWNQRYGVAPFLY